MVGFGGEGDKQRGRFGEARADSEIDLAPNISNQSGLNFTNASYAGVVETPINGQGGMAPTRRRHLT